jgi:hypothetical protein
VRRSAARLALGCLAALTASAASAQHEGHSAASPDPMAAMKEMEPSDRWTTMFHGYAFLNFNRQDGPSGGREFDSQNHLMLMSVRRLWGGKLSLLGAFTLEPATLPPEGSRELFQRGETYHGNLLVDRQHPHDLFVELGAAWERAVSPAAKVRLYLAPVGEPALGPVAYPHRLSASENPTAPLSHHNHDSTHISSDVITAGLTAGSVTIEGSGFHGREPDENRWDIDQGKLDSYSGRLTIAGPDGFSFQISAGFRAHPEQLEPGNQTRSTASVSYERGDASNFFAATLISGLNQTDGGREWGHLFEWTWKFGGKNSFYGRVEKVDRDLYELVNKKQRPEDIPRDRISVEALTLGFVRNIPILTDTETGVGADFTFYRFPSNLDSVYGSQPVSFHGFLRVRFGSHGQKDHEHGGMKM